MNNTLHHKYYFIYIYVYILDKQLVEYITLDDILYKNVFILSTNIIFKSVKKRIDLEFN